MPSKRKSAPARPKAVSAKRRKPAETGETGEAGEAVYDEKLRKLNDHVNMCVTRVNLLMEHADFLQKKMYELATLTNRELACFHFELEDLRSAAQKTSKDAYGLYPSMLTDDETSTQEEDILSEEMLIEAVGDFADSLP